MDDPIREATIDSNLYIPTPGIVGVAGLGFKGGMLYLEGSRQKGILLPSNHMYWQAEDTAGTSTITGSFHRPDLQVPVSCPVLFVCQSNKQQAVVQALPSHA